MQFPLEIASLPLQTDNLPPVRIDVFHSAKLELEITGELRCPSSPGIRKGPGPGIRSW